jgi:hypothetical protein
MQQDYYLPHQKAHHVNCVSILMQYGIGNLAVYPGHEMTEKDEYYRYINPEE